MPRKIFALLVTLFLMGSPAEAFGFKKVVRVAVYYPVKVALLVPKLAGFGLALAGLGTATAGAGLAVGAQLVDFTVDSLTE